MKRIALALLTAALIAIGVGVLPAAAAADTPQNEICTGAGAGANCTPPSGTPTVNNVLTNVINVLSAVIGAVAVIMIVVAGLQYVTSGGDSGKLNNARNTIMYALIGVAVVVLAQSFVHFVLQNVTKSG